MSESCRGLCLILFFQLVKNSTGWEIGWDDGWDDGWEVGRDVGWDDGWEVGWDDGWDDIDDEMVEMVVLDIVFSTREELNRYIIFYFDHLVWNPDRFSI